MKSSFSFTSNTKLLQKKLKNTIVVMNNLNLGNIKNIMNVWFPRNQSVNPPFYHSSTCYSMCSPLFLITP